MTPHTFIKYMDVAKFLLRQKGMRVMNYLDDWLILAWSEHELCAHRNLLLTHLEHPGYRINLAKSFLSPSQ